MKCSFCKKEIHGEAPFYFENGAYHVHLCLERAILVSRRNALRKKLEQEQSKLVRWNY